MTRFTVLRCPTSKKMEGIKRPLWEMFSLLNVRKVKQSDNWTDFVNQLIEELTRLNCINHRTISANKPCAHGAVERINATVENVLKKEPAGAMHNWPDYVPYVQLVCNAKPPDLTGVTRLSLMFGRNLNVFEK